MFLHITTHPTNYRSLPDTIGHRSVNSRHLSLNCFMFPSFLITPIIFCHNWSLSTNNNQKNMFLHITTHPTDYQPLPDTIGHRTRSVNSQFYYDRSCPEVTGERSCPKITSVQTKGSLTEMPPKTLWVGEHSHYCKYSRKRPLVVSTFGVKLGSENKWDARV